MWMNCIALWTSPAMSWLPSLLACCCLLPSAILLIVVLIENASGGMLSKSATPKERPTSHRSFPSTRPIGFEPADEPVPFSDPLPEQWAAHHRPGGS